MYGPDARLQPGMLSNSDHDGFERAGSSKLPFTTIFDACSDNAAKERNNTEKSRCLRIDPAHSLDRTANPIYRDRLREGKPCQYQYVYFCLRLGHQFDAPIPGPALVGGVGRHRRKRTIAMRGKPLGVDAGSRQRLHHRRRTGVGKRHVEFRGTDVIGVAYHPDAERGTAFHHFTDGMRGGFQEMVARGETGACGGKAVEVEAHRRGVPGMHELEWDPDLFVL